MGDSMISQHKLTQWRRIFMNCKCVNMQHVYFLVGAHTPDNFSKSLCSSQPRRGVHSWPAISYCQRNLKFHPLWPPPLSTRWQNFASEKNSLQSFPLSSHMESHANCWKHTYTWLNWRCNNCPFFQKAICGSLEHVNNESLSLFPPLIVGTAVGGYDWKRVMSYIYTSQIGSV